MGVFVGVDMENVYRLIERGSTTGPYFTTSAFGEVYHAAVKHTKETGKYVYIYDKDGFRGQTKKHKQGKQVIEVTVQWS